MAEPIARLVIVGAGLIGTSVQLAARRCWPEAQVVMLDRGDARAPLGSADVVVLATPVDAICSLLPSLPGSVRPEALIVDTGSTKRAIVRAARDAGLRRFVGGHPMAGAATSGPGAACADRFDGKPWFIVRGAADRTVVDEARHFVSSLGAVPVVEDDDGERHDRVMAAVSHLPQVVASALMVRVGEMVGDEGLAWSGGGLRDTTRLAASSADMWAGILSTNADELGPLLKALARDLDEAADQLSDAPAMRRLFDRARHWNEHQRAQSGVS